MVEQSSLEPGARVPGHYGAAGHGGTLAEVTTTACWNLQGDPAQASFVADVGRHFDLAPPNVPNTTARSAAWTALWIGPRSWLLVASVAMPIEPRLDVFTVARDALNLHRGALFDTSASQVSFVFGGPRAATVLTKSCPLDLHASTFPGGSCAQTLLGHVSVLLFRPDATPTFTIMAPRSLADDVWRTLCLSAAQYGYDVLAPCAFGVVR